MKMAFDLEPLKFIYRKEYWFANAFINTTQIDINEVITRIESEFRNRFGSIFDEKIQNASWDEQLKKSLQKTDFADKQDFDFKITWHPVLRGFPFRSVKKEKTESKEKNKKNKKTGFNQAGYFEFDVEYYKDNLESKKEIKPWIVHENVVYVLEQLKDILKSFDLLNNKILLDQDPMYLIVITDGIEKIEEGNRTEVSNFEWTAEAIQENKKSIFHWISPYSGKWERFNFRDEMVNQQITENLSFRNSELSYINKGSTFLFIERGEFNEFFESYYKPKIIDTIAHVRAFTNAMFEVNKDLDRLMTDINTTAYFRVEQIASKVAKLEFLVSKINSKISELNNELESNRFRYYKKVLRHLMISFNISEISKWLHEKLDEISKVMQNRYHKIQENAQKKLQMSTLLLNVLFGLGICADFVTIAFFYLDALNSGDFEKLIISGVLGIFILVSLVILLIWLYNVGSRRSEKKLVKKTVDAVIIHNDNIVLITRKYDPFSGKLALPGGFIELGETEEEAVVREAWEETGLDVKIEDEIGLFDESGRDPRGSFISYAFLCSTKNLDGLRPATDVVKVEAVPLEIWENKELAFDHKKIIKKALEKIKRR